ncbi:MAG: 4-alpha-glucanotransferase [Gemmataceae bacterium]|nr:4-alpha-glucanotransferase [Gemmataceae bacterium]
MSWPADRSRSSGILLHPTSLPGPFGIGDLGPQAHVWVDTMARAGQAWWQVLPVGPTGYGDSPYQSPSTFAGNLNLISPELLAADGLAAQGDLDGCLLVSGGPVHYADVISRKRRLVRRAWERFRAGEGPESVRAEFARFRAEEAAWLDEFALFMAIKDEHGGRAWWEWPAPLAAHDDRAVRAAAGQLADEIDAHRFGQFLFFRQWSSLRAHAHANGVRIIGDLPIYVAADSADVWGRPDLFLLDADRRPRFVAGVPPDYFSATGQLWGNPIYDWDAHRADGFRWWVDRVRAALRLFDLIRLDHFRGIEGFWAVRFGAPTAVEGEWLPGPGAALLAALRDALGDVPIIAEDLGVITPEVDALREQFGLPGMGILQFAFGGAVEPRFLPHRFTRDVVVYTGTHDNDTTAGWAAKLTADERRSYARYAPTSTEDPVGTLIRLGWASGADLVLAPLQDFLGLGSEARMNIPGTTTGNWVWRVDDRALSNPIWSNSLREFTDVYERRGERPVSNPATKSR